MTRATYLPLVNWGLVSFWGPPSFGKLPCWNFRVWTFSDRLCTIFSAWRDEIAEPVYLHAFQPETSQVCMFTLVIDQVFMVTMTGGREQCGLDLNLCPPSLAFSGRLGHLRYRREGLCQKSLHIWPQDSPTHFPILANLTLEFPSWPQEAQPPMSQPRPWTFRRYVPSIPSPKSPAARLLKSMAVRRENSNMQSMLGKYL